MTIPFEIGSRREPQAPVRSATLADAIARGRRLVLSMQRADGSWQERGDMGPLTTALALVALHHVAHLSDDELRDGARWLRSRQLGDGSFPGRPFSDDGDLGATAASWAALSLSRAAEDIEAARRASAYIDAHGGRDAVAQLAACGDVAPVVVAMVGGLDPTKLQTLPLSVVAVPKLLETLACRVSFYVITTALSVSLIARGLAVRTSGGFAAQMLARRVDQRAVELLTLYQNDNGSVMNVVYHTALLVPALRAAGVPTTDPRLANAIAWLRSRGARDDEGLFFDVYGSDVWSTASYLRVLLASGSRRTDACVVRAVSWLLDEQCRRPHPAFTNRKPGATRTGGWGFQSGEDAYPDCDTTSAVLDTLGRALVPDGAAEVGLPPALAKRVCAAIASGRQWLLGMQNDDGGWSSFFCGHPSKRPGPIMTRPLVMRAAAPSDPASWIRMLTECAEHLSDPSTEDVTSRVLVSLSRTGTAVHEPEVRRALDFLAAQQCPSGAWWGRWKVNYLPATAGALSALARIGDDLSKDATRRALGWIASRQNADGGFGESIASYRDPALAGCGPSSAPLTGSVLLGLADAGEETSAAAERAVSYLLSTQQEDGAWPNGDSVATLVPPDLFYVYGGAARYIPLEALVRVQARLAARQGAS